MSAMTTTARRAPRLTFGGALRAEWCKIWSATSTYVLGVLTIAFLLINSAMMGWLLSLLASDITPVGHEDIWSTASAGASNALVIVGILGVMALTGEFSSSSIVSSLTVDPRRAMFMHAKALVVAAVTFLASLVGVLLAWGVAAAMVGPHLTTGTKWTPAAMPVVTLLGLPLMMAFAAVLAMGLGAICRSTVGGVLCVVVLFTIVPSVLQMAQLLGRRYLWITSINNCLPANALTAFLSAGASTFANDAAAVLDIDGAQPFQPAWGMAGLIFVVWSVVFYAVGVLMMCRRDVK
ncbi:ABC transporter permease [Bifidobacterium anseris]|uniref:ABC transporter permease n=1 Tax=Bifidobacterium anseris TaxID=2020963 RepID=A0A2N5IW00_9BIFI|nr:MULTISPECIES: ABC transporter permease [Bifidobacterium]PLS26130.1 ABC transporter permease [Bifidobacterium anseris]